MKLKLQPKRSRTCGAHCIAMITGQPVNKVLDIIGHERGTDFNEVALALRRLGWTKASKKKMPFFYQHQLPKICMIALRWTKGGGHWVVYNDGKIYCPGRGIYDYNMKNIDKQGVELKYYLYVGEKEQEWQF